MKKNEDDLIRLIESNYIAGRIPEAKYYCDELGESIIRNYWHTVLYLTGKPMAEVTLSEFSIINIYLRSIVHETTLDDPIREKALKILLEFLPQADRVYYHEKISSGERFTKFDFQYIKTFEKVRSVQAATTLVEFLNLLLVLDPTNKKALLLLIKYTQKIFLDAEKLKKERSSVVRESIIWKEKLDNVLEEFERQHPGQDPFKEISDPRCFVATAVYGTKTHRSLDILRSFRDQVLLDTNAGKQFVKWYYQNGPTAAAIIEKSPFLKEIAYRFIVLPSLLVSVIALFFMRQKRKYLD